MQLKKYFILILVFVLPSLWVSGCAAPPGLNHPAASDSVSNTPSPQAISTNPPNPTTNTPPTPLLTQPPASTPTRIWVSESLWLRVTAPLDNAVVNSATLWITGEAPAWTVLSINEEILLVDESGKFTIQIELQEGINLIEIIASDIQGNEIPLILGVTYEP